MTSASTDELRHNFLRSHQGGTAFFFFFLPSLMEEGKQAARPGAVPAPTPPRVIVPALIRDTQLSRDVI